MRRNPIFAGFFVVLLLSMIGLWSLPQALLLTTPGRVACTMDNDMVNSPQKKYNGEDEDLFTRKNVPMPRFLLGIFTMNTEKDKERRKLIRETYLTSFQTFRQRGDPSRGTICKLTELMRPDGPGRLQSCQLAYAFVAGRYNKTDMASGAPTEIFGENVEDFLYEEPAIQEEDDVLQLNLRENMNDGKSTTWFRFASMALPQVLGISLIGKIDSDAVLFPRALLRELEGEIQQVDTHRTYGSYMKIVRGGEEKPFMQGGFYFLSSQLAQDITSKACPREKILQHSRIDLKSAPGEDREIGAFVHACTGVASGRRRPLRYQEILVSGDVVSHGSHPFKDAEVFQAKWAEGVAQGK